MVELLLHFRACFDEHKAHNRYLYLGQMSNFVGTFCRPVQSNTSSYVQ